MFKSKLSLYTPDLTFKNLHRLVLIFFYRCLTMQSLIPIRQESIFQIDWLSKIIKTVSTLFYLINLHTPPPPNRNSVVFRKVEVPYCTLKIGTSNITIFTQYCLITHLQRTMPTTISSVENVRNGNTTENVRSIMLNAVLVALANSCNQCFEASFT